MYINYAEPKLLYKLQLLQVVQRQFITEKLLLPLLINGSVPLALACKSYPALPCLN
jgi:hypothetical protein